MGFTLIELMVVIAIILILLGVVVPGLSKMWEERKFSQSETLIDGMLATTRARALNSREHGLLFMLDTNGVQKVFPIEAEPLDPVVDGPTWTQKTVSNRFIISAANAAKSGNTPPSPGRFPAPVRVAPRQIVDYVDPVNQTGPIWEPAEVVREIYNATSPPPNGVQWHRNFFTIVYGPDGRLVPGRDVVVHDPDANGDFVGDYTGLVVCNPPGTTDWYGEAQNNPYTVQPVVRKFDGFATALPDLICADNNVALNFKSVDGLLVYDESLFQEQSADAGLRRQFLIDSGQPLYVSRLSGDLVRGPKGENE